MVHRQPYTFKMLAGLLLFFESPVLEQDKYYEDLGILIFDADGDGDNDFYIASGGNEFKRGSLGYEDRLYENLGKGQWRRNLESIPDTKTSGAEISAADFDKDGDLDLFVGGRLVPKKYPFPADSYILENVSTAAGPMFKDITEQVLPELKSLGLVTASVWTDFDQDGWQDLIVVGEWLPLTFFKNNEGVFKNVSATMLEGNTRMVV